MPSGNLGTIVSAEEHRAVYEKHSSYLHLGVMEKFACIKDIKDIKEVNKICKKMPKEEKKRLKRERRTYKNRYVLMLLTYNLWSVSFDNNESLQLHAL